MKRHSIQYKKHGVLASLALAFAPLSAPLAEEVRLFPPTTQTVPLPPIPGQPQTVSTPAPAAAAPAATQVAQPVELHVNEPTPSAAALAQPPQTGNGPLRVIIPNVKAAKPVTARAKTEAHKPKREAQETAAIGTRVISAPASPAQAASPAAGIATRIAEQAQEAWQNGVSLAQWSGQEVIRHIVKPAIAFLPVPQQWALAGEETPTVQAATNSQALTAETVSLASLAPAAGQSAEAIPVTTAPTPTFMPLESAQPNNIILPNPIPQPAQQAASPAPTIVKAEIQPAAQVIAQPTVVHSAPVAAAPAEPNSVTLPGLSSQSRDIAAKVKPEPDKLPEKPFHRKVDIDRAKPPVDVLSSAAGTPSNAEAMGIKTGGTKSGLSVNYELERAYNALIAGQSETAIQIYEDILTSNPKNKEALFGLASTYHRVGRLDMARSLYGKLLQVDPKHRDGLNNFLVLLADEAPQEALAQMEQLEQQNPDFSPIPAQMAIIYQKLGDREKAIDKMYRALAIAPENMTYRYNLAIMLDKNAQYRDAVTLYGQLLAAHAKGEPIPGDASKIQQRLTFLRSNTVR